MCRYHATFVKAYLHTRSTLHLKTTSISFDDYAGQQHPEKVRYGQCPAGQYLLMVMIESLLWRFILFDEKSEYAFRLFDLYYALRFRLVSFRYIRNRLKISYALYLKRRADKMDNDVDTF